MVHCWLDLEHGMYRVYVQHLHFKVCKKLPSSSGSPEFGAGYHRCSPDILSSCNPTMFRLTDKAEKDDDGPTTGATNLIVQIPLTGSAPYTLANANPCYFVWNFGWFRVRRALWSSMSDVSNLVGSVGAGRLLENREPVPDATW
uniref:Uncharacterized protein n=1 Tax=Coccidioides posadasii RMSCC 3488 TaxID=454284 RepID=A0A0J6FC55_COCPO|nr:hypothetical protein CPAG_03197 [Coccidioides posadasii RMSCC 3488]